MENLMREAMKTNPGDKPLTFNVSNEDPLHKELIDMAIRMAQVGLERAGRDMDGVVTMRFDPNKITFEYVPNPRGV